MMKKSLVGFALLYALFALYSLWVGSPIEYWMGSFLLAGFSVLLLKRGESTHKHTKIVRLGLVYGTWFFLVTFFCYCVWNILAVKVESLQGVTHVLVFGASISEKKVNACAEARLQTMIEMMQDMPWVKVVVSGGRDVDALSAEAVLMKQYLVSRGVEASRITVEDQATSSAENIKYSMPYLRQNGFLPSEKLGVLSNDFHLPRIKLLCERYGIEAVPIVAPTPWEEIPRCYVREYFATVKSFLVD